MFVDHVSVNIAIVFFFSLCSSCHDILLVLLFLSRQGIRLYLVLALQIRSKYDVTDCVGCYAYILFLHKALQRMTQGYEADSVFDEEDGFSDSYSDRRTLGRNSVQVNQYFNIYLLPFLLFVF